MKKTLSIFLAIIMMLSVNIFATPQMAGVVDSVKEVTDEKAQQPFLEEKATLTEEVWEETAVLKEYEFNTNGNVESFWVNTATCSYSVADGNLLFKTLSNQQTAKIYSPKAMNIDTSTVSYIEIKTKASASNVGLRMYYICDVGSESFDNSVRKVYNGTDWNIFTFDVEDFTGKWGGKLTQLRLDFGNAADADYAIDYIKICHTVNFKPGVNMLTGTKASLDFDNLEIGSVTDGTLEDASGKRVLVYDNGVTTTLNVVETDAFGGKAAMLSDYNHTSKYIYPYLNFTSYPAPDDGRPVLVTFDAYIKKFYDETQTALTGGTKEVFVNFRGTGAGKETVKIDVFAVTAEPEWTSVYVKDEKSGKNGIASIQFNAALTDAGLAKYNSEKKDIMRHYIDNIGYYPYYKVTYMNGGTEVASVYVLDEKDADGNITGILKSFNPEEQGVAFPEGKNAWAHAEDGEKVTKVALNNKDIVLYAIKEDVAPEIKDELLFSFEFNNNASDNLWWIASGVSPDGTKNRGKSIDGKFVFDATKTSSGSWDTKMSVENKNYGLDTSKISRVEVRAKILDENGNPQTLLSNTGCDFYFATTTSSTLRGDTSLKYVNLTPDAEGYYTFVWTAEMFESKTWTGEINSLRFDPHGNVGGTVYMDYIRFYGYKDNFAPTTVAPEKREGFGLRVDSTDKTGVRFRAAVSNDLRARTDLVEYGWIVALADTLGDEELTHEFKSSNGKLSYVEGKSYGTVDGNKIDKIYEIEESYTVFTAVVTGVPVEYADKYIVVRPYTVISGAYSYGNSIVTSPKEVGQKFYDKWVAAGCPEGDMNYDYVKYQEYIDTLGIKK